MQDRAQRDSAASPRRVLLASPHGSCAGVNRAVATVEHALRLHGAPVYVRKQIVHNAYVVRALQAKGAIFVEETADVPEGSLVVFSAHGVATAVHADAAQRRLRTIDATCPLVSKVHNEARRFARDDYDILLIGHSGHEEVVGTTGVAPGHIQLVDGPQAVDSIEVRDPAKVAWLSQTTLSVDETMATVASLRRRFPLLTGPPSDDICYATQNRQVAVRAIAKESCFVLVVGSPNSSNSVRLVEVALESGAGGARLVDDAGEIDPRWLDGVSTVGVSSGASVPEILVHEVIDWLMARGYRALEVVRAAEETVTFALPPELRRQLAAAQASAGVRRKLP
jgi:4-hydroxy-3-methylbut-2-enyl diphosphate reductase